MPPPSGAPRPERSMANLSTTSDSDESASDWGHLPSNGDGDNASTNADNSPMGPPACQPTAPYPKDCPVAAWGHLPSTDSSRRADTSARETRTTGAAAAAAADTRPDWGHLPSAHRSGRGDGGGGGRATYRDPSNKSPRACRPRQRHSVLFEYDAYRAAAGARRGHQVLSKLVRLEGVCSKYGGSYLRPGADVEMDNGAPAPAGANTKAPPAPRLWHTRVHPLYAARYGDDPNWGVNDAPGVLLCQRSPPAHRRPA
ncbi:hypothetical protein GGS23DRAFT_610452 [Durotheca rogersii]|uniref:uncharacterized protein n=1 Tax=Durotheca rogersii TaxID=419775 RepID=UPI002220E409|nr:uncharacterized protein GGS23DRAFT_610452 [Durotheca rogersii]KAI5862710.1 hypothetical protein GGS23DRAFT_610452 [Durotheca rogersii]